MTAPSLRDVIQAALVPGKTSGLAMDPAHRPRIEAAFREAAQAGRDADIGDAMMMIGMLQKSNGAEAAASLAAICIDLSALPVGNQTLGQQFKAAEPGMFAKHAGSGPVLPASIGERPPAGSVKPGALAPRIIRR